MSKFCLITVSFSIGVVSCLFIFCLFLMSAARKIACQRDCFAPSFYRYIAYHVSCRIADDFYAIVYSTVLIMTTNSPKGKGLIVIVDLLAMFRNSTSAVVYVMVPYFFSKLSQLFFTSVFSFDSFFC